MSTAYAATETPTSSLGKLPAPAMPSPPPWRHTAKQWTSWVDTSQATPSSGLTGGRTRRPTQSLASARLAPPAGVFLDTITKHSVSPPREIDIGIPLQPEEALVALIAKPSDWIAPYVAYLEGGTLPADQTEARMIAHRCKSFVIINGELHKRSVTDMFQR